MAHASVAGRPMCVHHDCHRPEDVTTVLTDIEGGSGEVGFCWKHAALWGIIPSSEGE